MMKTSLFSLLFFLSVSAPAQRAPTLEYVRELIAAKNTSEAAKLLKTDYGRLLKSDKDHRDVAQWFSIFLYETSMETYEKAEELSAGDTAGAKEQFEALLEKEPQNKVALSSYISFLIEKEKWADAQDLSEKSHVQFPYFTIFSVLKWWVSVAQGNSSPTVTCDRRTLTAVEQEVCYLVHLMSRVNVKDAKKKPSENELKNLVSKTTIPDAYYWAWKASNNATFLKRYVNLCRGLTEKYKKNYRIVPGLCAKMQESESQLEPKQNEEPNAN